MSEANGETGKFVALKLYNEATGEYDNYNGQIYSGIATAYKQHTGTTAADVVAAVSGKAIYVTWMHIYASGNTDPVTLGDSTTTIFRWTAINAKTSQEFGNGRSVILRTTPGQALTVDSTGTTDTWDITVAYFTKDISP